MLRTLKSYPKAINLLLAGTLVLPWPGQSPCPTW